MRTGWRNYFVFCPDDWVTHEEVLQNGEQVREWRVYADNKPVYDILAKAKAHSGRVTKNKESSFGCDSRHRPAVEDARVALREGRNNARG
jgi:hypothetical protein